MIAAIVGELVLILMGRTGPVPHGRPGPNNPNSGLGRAGLSPHHGCWRADPDGVDTGKFVLPSLELGSPSRGPD